MNIWFISKYAGPPQYSKMPSRLFCLAREFKRLGNKVILITSDSNHFSNYPDTSNVYNDESKEGVDIRWVKTIKYLKTASISRIISWFDFEKKLFLMNRKSLNKPNVVVVSSLSIFSIFYGYFLKCKYKAFLVFEIRDIWPLTMTEEGGFSRLHPLVLLIGWIERFGYKKADLIVGTMPKLDLHVRNILGYDRPFFCSPLGFDPDNYLRSAEEIENPFQKYVSENRIIVGYAGSMGITNALEPFIQTIKLMKDDSRVQFLLVGSGDLRRTFEMELDGLTNVTFLPRIAQNEVRLFLDVCDITYLSTKRSKVWDYGQSMNKVVEYMLAGKPIIASYSGFQSMINEADCGVFLKDCDSNELAKVIDNFASLTNVEREEIGKRGREWVYSNRKYSYLAKKYLDAINSLKNV